MVHSWPLDSQIAVKKTGMTKLKKYCFSPPPPFINYELLLINASEVIIISINDANNLTTSRSVKLQLPV